MSEIKLPVLQHPPLASAILEIGAMRLLDPDLRELLHMAGQLSPRDRAVLSHVIRRATEICDADGEEVALAVIEQVQAIILGRPADA